MTKEELKEYLKNNLRVYVTLSDEPYSYSGKRVTVEITLDDEVITQDYDSWIE